MIRRSSSKHGNKKRVSKKTPRKSAKGELICNLCKKDGKHYSTKRELDMEAHLDKRHSQSRDKGVDLKMFFEMLRVMGVVAIGTGIYAIGNNIENQYIDANDSLSEARDIAGNKLVSDE